MSSDAVYREYYERVLIFVRIKINYHADAEDLTQDILSGFIEARSKGSALQKDDPLPYLYGICSNKIKDWFKKRQRDKRFDNMETAQIREPSEEVLEKLITDEERRQVNRILKKLKPVEQRILYLRYYQGLSYEEIAPLLNMKPAAVRKAAQRARERMRKRLKNVLVTYLIFWLLINWGFVLSRN